MQINELIGYKNNPIYKQAIKSYQPDSTWGKQRARDTKARSFKNFMVDNGFKYIGNGAFSRVFEKDNYPWVFKIFNQDAAYLAFINYALQHQDNPHLPRFKGKPIKINDDTYAIRIEKLKDVEDGNLSEKQDELLKVLINIPKRPTLPDNYFTHYINEFYPKLYVTLVDISKLGYTFDLHLGNIMLRGNTIVLADPVFDKSVLESNLTEIASYKNNKVYKKARQVFKNNPDNTFLSNYAQSLYRDKKFDTFTKYLKKYGFNRIGSGTFATAYIKDGYPWVIKIFNQDKAYFAFLQYALKHQDNPHLPKFKGGPIKIDDNTYAIRIEKLTPSHNVSVELKKFMHYIQYYKSSRARLAAIKAEYPYIYKTIVDISRLNFRLDMHDDNIMFRGTTLVFADPICDEDMV